MARDVDITKAINEWADRAETTVDKAMDMVTSAFKMIDEGSSAKTIGNRFEWASLAEERVVTIYYMLKDFGFDRLWVEQMWQDVNTLRAHLRKAERHLHAREMGD